MLDVFTKLSLPQRVGRFCSCGRPASYLFTFNGNTEHWCKKHRDKCIEVNKPCKDFTYDRPGIMNTFGMSDND